MNTSEIFSLAHGDHGVNPYRSLSVMRDNFYSVSVALKRNTPSDSLVNNVN